MTTRLKDAIVKPNPKYAVASYVPSDSKPTTIAQALKDPWWKQVGVYVGWVGPSFKIQ